MDSRFEKGMGKEEWLTPKGLVDLLGPFDLDPCFSNPRPWNTARKHYGIEEDGLKQDWQGFVWCNPPYGTKTGAWLQKASKHNDCICLIFARTDTKMFQEHVFPKASALFFWRGRLKFCDVHGKAGGPAGAPSCLVAYGSYAREKLRKLSPNIGYFVDLIKEDANISLNP